MGAWKRPGRKIDDIEKYGPTNQIKKESISQPKFLYGTGSLVLCDPDIDSPGMVPGMQESDLPIAEVQETSEVSWIVYYLSSHIYSTSLIQESNVCHVEVTGGSEKQKVNDEEDKSRGEGRQDAIEEEESNSNQAGMSIFMIIIFREP